MAESKKTETPKSLPPKKTETPKSLPPKKTQKPKKVLRVERQLMVPIEPFAVPSKDGRPARVINKDTPLWSDDPIVKRHRPQFMTAGESLLGRGEVVHTATAAPGVIAAAPGVNLAAVGDE